jgi:hypothetical protein
MPLGLPRQQKMKIPNPSGTEGLKDRIFYIMRENHKFVFYKGKHLFIQKNCSLKNLYNQVPCKETKKRDDVT